MHYSTKYCNPKFCVVISTGLESIDKLSQLQESEGEREGLGRDVQNIQNLVKNSVKASPKPFLLLFLKEKPEKAARKLMNLISLVQ